MTFVQDGAPAHTSKAAQTWCQKNLPNFIAKDGWPANSPDLNPIENIWSIIDETTYLDPALKTMKELKRRLSFAWKNVTLDTLQELTHSIGAKKMPLKIKAGILVTNNWNDRMKNRQTIRCPIFKMLRWINNETLEKTNRIEALKHPLWRHHWANLHILIKLNVSGTKRDVLVQ